MARKVIVLIVSSLVLVGTGVSAYSDLSGRDLVPPWLGLLLLVLALLIWLPFFVRKRADYNQFLSKNPVEAASDKRTRRLLFVGLVLIFFGLFLSVIGRVIWIRFPSDWVILSVWAASLLSIVIGFALVLSRVISWWLRYFRQHIQR